MALPVEICKKKKKQNPKKLSVLGFSFILPWSRDNGPATNPHSRGQKKKKSLKTWEMLNNVLNATVGNTLDLNSRFTTKKKKVKKQKKQKKTTKTASQNHNEWIAKFPS